MPAVTRDEDGGSSPRVRGTHPVCLCGTMFGRFIPAGAGNADDCHCLEMSRTVHPRGCGERDHPRGVVKCGLGSSPRVRGTRPPRPRRPRRCRFIPAGAGNAWAREHDLINAAVHPRGCGERPSQHHCRWKSVGSSPRVRATPSGRRRGHPEFRFIPAGAGNAPWFWRQRRLRPVHPRGCGERPSALARFSTMRGSSPRVRGTRGRGFLDSLKNRFIPAGAGNAGGREQ